MKTMKGMMFKEGTLYKRQHDDSYGPLQFQWRKLRLLRRALVFPRRKILAHGEPVAARCDGV